MRKYAMMFSTTYEVYEEYPDCYIKSHTLLFTISSPLPTKHENPITELYLQIAFAKVCFELRCGYIRLGRCGYFCFPRWSF